MQLEIKWKENSETLETLGLDPHYALNCSTASSFPALPPVSPAPAHSGSCLSRVPPAAPPGFYASAPADVNRLLDKRVCGQRSFTHANQYCFPY